MMKNLMNKEKNRIKQNPKIYLMIFLLIIIPFILFMNLADKKKDQEEKNPNKNSRKILVEKLKPEKRREIFEYSGFLEPKEIVNVFGQVDGMIDEILVNQGQKVKKGDILIKIDEQERKAEFEKAQQLVFQKNEELKNNQKLFNEKIISKVKLDESRTAQKDALANLEKTKKNLEFTKILAPIDGYIDKINFKIGDYIKHSALTPVAKIFSTKEFIVSIFVSQNNIFQIRKNQNARFILGFNDGKSIFKNGKINFISSIADEMTRTYYTEILIDQNNQGDLDDLAKAIGSSVNVKIEGDEKEAININNSVIFLDDDGILIAKFLDQNNSVKFLKVNLIENINNDAKDWFSIDEKEAKDLNLFDKDGFLKLIARGAGFLQKNEVIENFGFASE
jgi:multidrug efflux system membrane fusion protein